MNKVKLGVVVCIRNIR